MDHRFEQVDMRFEQVDERFEQVDKRFGQIDKKLGKIDMRLGIFHFEWDEWKQDALTEFNSKWITRIDPILADIEKHREQEVLWGEQNRRSEEKVDRLADDFKQQEKKIDYMGKILDQVAKKIGV